MPKKKIHTKPHVHAETIERISFWTLLSLLGAFLIILSSFLPWLTITTVGIQSLIMHGAKNIMTFNLWTMENTAAAGFIYIIPVSLSLLISFFELILAKTLPAFGKILLLVLLCLTTITFSMYMFAGVFGAQYFLDHFTLKLPFDILGGKIVLKDIMKIGSGLYVSLAGCFLLLLGLLGEIKRQIKTT